MNPLLDLRTECDDAEITLLLCEMGYPAEIRERKALSILHEYQIHPKQPLLGLKIQDELIGLIGLRSLSKDEAEIRHIVVRPRNRHSGIGQQLIFGARTKLKLTGLVAETDADAVIFYQKLGFQITPMESPYPETERFRCVLKTVPSAPL